MFAKLTINVSLNHDSKPSFVYINPDKVQSVHRSTAGDGKGACVSLDPGEDENYWNVKESPEDVVTLLEAMLYKKAQLSNPAKASTGPR